mgnify:CR=1 FL=1
MISGHGGFDPGKVGVNGAKEKDINLAIVQKLKTLLEQENIRVVLTRETDVALYEVSTVPSTFSLQFPIISFYKYMRYPLINIL